MITVIREIKESNSGGYVVQIYDRYPIHEPAEGGYYYEGLEPSDYYECSNLIEAKKLLMEIVEEENEGLESGDRDYIAVSSDGLHAQSTNTRYIGDGIEIHVEKASKQGEHASGWHPYE